MPKLVLVAMHVAAVLCSALPLAALAQDPADTSKLPRPADAQVIYESAQTTILRTTKSAESIATELEKLLAGAGWQNYQEMQQRREPDAAARTLVARKGAIGLEARVAPAPAQGNATTINFITNPLRHDVPFPHLSSLHVHVVPCWCRCFASFSERRAEAT